VDEDDDIQYPSNIYNSSQQGSKKDIAQKQKQKKKIKKELISNLLDIPEIPAFNPNKKKP